MTRSRFLFAWLAAAVLVLAACSKQDAPAAAKDAPKRAPTVEIMAAEGKGFTVGSMMSANAVYVLFDAQCPHCARLWEASLPLHKKAKFVWIPVGLINASSTSQGAAMLTSADPFQTMTEHEKSLLAGQGGIAASASIPPETEQAIKNNTRLFNNLGLEGVPFVVARNLRSGQTVTRGGSMSTAALADLLGVDAP
jgi:thiol:disulfide interchange protein DsbG